MAHSVHHKASERSAQPRLPDRNILRLMPNADPAIQASSCEQSAPPPLLCFHHHRTPLGAALDFLIDPPWPSNIKTRVATE